jgi:phosphatidylserine/phosphatidylglycerophosphate/cardiolipin synthase-like enzyme
MKNRIAFIIAFTLSASTLFSQTISIADARMLNDDDTVTVSGTVTNGAELGSIRYFQDGTAGIPAYGSSVSAVLRNDSITITGILKTYNGLLELDPVLSLSNHGQAEVAIVPEIYTAGEIGESTEGQLVQIDQVVFADGGASFAGGSTYNFTADGESGVIYIRNGHPLIGEIIPVSPVTLIAISSQFSFTGFGGHQLLPRDPDDIINNSSINIVSSISQSNLSTTGFTLSWITDVASSTGVFYGTDEFADISEMTVAYTEESVSTHDIDLSGLNDGTVYFAKAFSVLGSDTAFSTVSAFATVSLSSGEMVVLFNFPVNHNVASGDDNLATYTSLIQDSVVSWIDRSMISLDIAMYNTNMPVIQDAINDAYDRGVQIRYIAEGGNANIGLDYLNLNIPVLYRENATSSGMHNKFLIIDADSTENAWIMGGSTNFSDNMIVDPNNMIFIQDQSLARAYRVEFEEMWGSNGPQPNPANSKFGEEKTNNTPHNFKINGDDVELYFSPSDGVTQVIVETILSANSSVNFETLVFTRDDIADAVIQMNDDFFVTALGIIEQINTSGSEYQVLLDNDVNVLSHQDLPGQLHHKLAIIDHDAPDQDPIVLTGSHNWSSSAENTNDENTLVIHSAAIANQYYQEFSARWNELTVGIAENGKPLHIVLYPNPAKNQITFIQSDFSGQFDICIQDMSGKTMLTKQINASIGEENQLDISSLSIGIYSITIRTQTGQKTIKFIKN